MWRKGEFIFTDLCADFQREPLGAMVSIPIVSRLAMRDYLRIAWALSILLIESVLRMVMWIVPGSWIGWFNSRRFIPRLFRDPDSPLPVQDCLDMIKERGYGAELHTCVTQDGYLLVMHRITTTRASSTPLSRVSSNQSIRSSNAPASKVVFLMHGCMMSSDVWVCHPRDNLAFTLADAGYDVWMGNIRGNKYSNKHHSMTINDARYWDWSLDEVILHDLPAMITYILKATKRSNLSYIGFSQGSMIGMAALAHHPALSKRVRTFIALGAVTKPHGPSHPIVKGLVHATPEIIFLFFSRKVFLSSLCFWRDLLNPRIYARILDFFMTWLFGWHLRGISDCYKPHLYQYLYGFTSTKLLVHWFQIIGQGRFQMYDEAPSGSMARGHVPPPFPLEQITQTPLLICHGTHDTLIDPHYTAQSLHPAVMDDCAIEGWEHLDFLWGDHLLDTLLPRILSRLDPK